MKRSKDAGLYGDRIEVLNEGLYSEYVERVKAVIEKYGGKYLVRGGRVTSLSGGWNPERIVIIEFKDAERCRACFRSEEYHEIAHLREKSTRGRSIIVEGLTTP